MNDKRENKIKEIRAVVEKVITGERTVCCALLIIMLLITFLQVVMRFTFNSPFSWSEELTLIFLVWFGYLCMPIGIFHDFHVALYFLYDRLPVALKKAVDIMRHGLLMWLFSQMIVYGYTITKLNMPKLQPATRVSQGWLFAPLIVGGVLMLIYCALNLLTTILKPLDAYRKEAETEWSIEQLNKERGGTE